MTLIAFYLPKEVLYGVVGVSGATIFYDTIFKRFQKLFDNPTEVKREEEND